MFDIEKLLIDVFAPVKGENFILLNDFPLKEVDFTAEYLERKDMVKQWHKALEKLSEKMGFTIFSDLPFIGTELFASQGSSFRKFISL